MTGGIDDEELARISVDCGYHLHRELGPGPLESAYEVLRAESFRQAGLVLTYLRLVNLPLGLLMNFGQGTFKDGLKRVANDYTGPFGKT